MNHLLFALIGLLLLPAVSHASGYLKSQNIVAGNDGRTCAAYIHALDDSKNLPIVVALEGTGVYTTGNFVGANAVAKTLIDQKKAIFLSIDKPGIFYSETATDHFTINDSVYNLYTQSDLIECVIKGIRWISKTQYSTPTSDIYFLGHSVSTQVAIRIYDNLLKNNPVTAGRIKGLFLSGVVMKS